MKKFLLGTVGLVALGMAAPATAADMTYKAPPRLLRTCRRSTTGPASTSAATAAWDGRSSAQRRDWLLLAAGLPRAVRWLVGGQIGYRWQAASGYLASKLRAIGRISATRASAFSMHQVLRLSTKTDGIGLFTGQIGYAWNASLLYVKGGAAVTDNGFSILGNANGLNGRRQAQPAGVAPWVLDGSMASHRIGLSVLNTTTCSWAHANNSLIPTRVSRSLPLIIRVSQDVDLVTFRVNYRFGGYGAGYGGPGVARY